MRDFVVFTNFIPPYRKSLYERISSLLDDKITFYVSTPIEANRKWTVDWGTLNVRIQKSFKIKYIWKQKNAFSETAYIHLPIDTLILLLREKPKAIVSSEFGFRTLLCCIYKFFSPDTKLIIWATVSEQSEVGRGWIRLLLRKWLLRFSTLIFTNGQSGINYLKSIADLSDDQFVQIPYTVDEKLFKCPPKRGFGKPGVITLLYVGHVSARKGITTAIEILKKWCRKNQNVKICLNMVGNIELKNFSEVFEDQPENLKLDVFNHIAYEALRTFYNSADYLLFPTLADEWGVVVNESLVAGVPVIGSIYSQAVLELVKEEWNGWKIDIHRECSLMEALDKACALSEQDLIDMRNNACNSLEGYDLDSVAQRFCENLV